MLSPVSTWMGDRLGTLDAAGIFARDKSQTFLFFSFPFSSTTRDWKRLDLALSDANGHITLNTPVLVRSLKLSNVESSQYLDGWPPGNTGCCWLPSFFFFFSRFLFKIPFFFSHPFCKITRVFAQKMVEKSCENTRQPPWNENTGQKD